MARKPAPRNADGRQAAHVPTKVTRKLVSELVGFGIEQPHIAERLGITDRTLRKYYKSELETGQSLLVSKVAASLFKKAMSPKSGMPGVTAAIFILKTRGRWKEATVVEHTGSDGAPLQTGGANVVLVLPDNNRNAHLFESGKQHALIEARPATTYTVEPEEP